MRFSSAPPPRSADVFFSLLLFSADTDFDRSAILQHESDLWFDRLLFDLTFARQFFFVQFRLRLENNLPGAIVLQRAANFGQFSAMLLSIIFAGPPRNCYSRNARIFNFLVHKFKTFSALTRW